MGRAPCCDKANVKRGPWSPEEDAKLKQYIDKYGTGGNWIALPQKVGLRRCGKSCRLRWLNYLRPNIKHGEFSEEEDRIIINLFANIGSRWSIIAAQLPGRTDNDIKNYWNTKLKKKLMGIIDQPSQRKPHLSTNNNISLSSSSSTTTYSSSAPLPSNSSCGSHYSSQAAASGGGPFTTTSTFEPISAFSTISTFSSNTSTSTNSNGGGGSFLQHQVSTQESFLSQMQQQHCSSGGLIMFGNQASCGSSNNNYHIDGVIFNQESQKSMISSNGDFVNNGWEKLSHDQVSSFPEYGTLGEIGLEEIKQLISSTSTSCNNINNNNNNNNFLFDENKTEERVLYYY